MDEPAENSTESFLAIIHDLQDSLQTAAEHFRQISEIMNGFAEVYPDQVQFWNSYAKQTGANRKILALSESEMNSLPVFQKTVQDLSDHVDLLCKLSDLFNQLKLAKSEDK